MPLDNDYSQDIGEPSRPIRNSDTPLEAEPVADGQPLGSPPHPGFWWAVLWCLGILLVTQLLPGVFAVIVLIFTAPQGINPEQLADAQAILNMPGYARAMLWALALSQFLSLASAWLSIRLVVGKEWPRHLGLRWPSLSHLVLALRVARSHGPRHWP